MSRCIDIYIYYNYIYIYIFNTHIHIHIHIYIIYIYPYTARPSFRTTTFFTFLICLEFIYFYVAENIEVLLLLGLFLERIRYQPIDILWPISYYGQYYIIIY